MSAKALTAMAQNAQAFKSLSANAQAFTSAAQSAQAFTASAAAAQMAAKGRLDAQALTAMAVNPQAFTAMAMDPKAFTAMANNAQALSALARNGEAFKSLGMSAQFKALALNPSFSAALEIVVNATSLGMGVVVTTSGGGEPLPLDASRLGSGQVLVDLIYHPAVTPLIHAARGAGAVAVNGLGMLIHQAALAFRAWTGEDAPLEAMSAAALAGLRRAENA